jgi:hypothetical protein
MRGLIKRCHFRGIVTASLAAFEASLGWCASITIKVAFAVFRRLLSHSYLCSSIRMMVRHHCFTAQSWLVRVTRQSSRTGQSGQSPGPPAVARAICRSQVPGFCSIAVAAIPQRIGNLIGLTTA